MAANNFKMASFLIHCVDQALGPAASFSQHFGPLPFDHFRVAIGADGALQSEKTMKLATAQHRKRKEPGYKVGNCMACIFHKRRQAHSK